MTNNDYLKKTLIINSFYMTSKLVIQIHVEY